jgi:hypothetical protein
VPADLESEIAYYEKLLADLKKATGDVTSKGRIGPAVTDRVKAVLESKKLDRIAAYENARQADLVETPNLGPIAQDGIRYDFNQLAQQNSPLDYPQGIQPGQVVPNIPAPRPGVTVLGLTRTQPGIDLKGPGYGQVYIKSDLPPALRDETMLHEEQHLKEGLGQPPKRASVPPSGNQTVRISQEYENELADRYNALPPNLQDIWRMQQVLKSQEVDSNPDHHAWHKAYQGYKRPY